MSDNNLLNLIKTNKFAQFAIVVISVSNFI